MIIKTLATEPHMAQLGRHSREPGSWVASLKSGHRSGVCRLIGASEPPRRAAKTQGGLLADEFAAKVPELCLLPTLVSIEQSALTSHAGNVRKQGESTIPRICLAN